MNINDFVKKNSEYLNDHPLIVSVVVFILIFFIFSFIKIYADGDPIMGDHYFHIKYARLLRTEGISAVDNFDFIYSVDVDDMGRDRYAVNLFQVALIPFTYFKDLLLGLHLADVFQISVFTSIVYYIMRKSKVEYAFFFTILLFTSAYFVMRLLIGRAFVLAVALIFVEMYFAINKKCKSLFLVSLIHVLWHQSTYFMPLIAVSAVEIARYLTIVKFYWKNIIFVTASVIIGMAFFPGFPMSILNWISNIFAIQTGSMIGSEVQSIGGNELLSKDFMSYFASNVILLASFVFGIIGTIFLYILQKQKNIPESIERYMIWIDALFLFVIVMMFGTVTISGRFFDFLSPAVFVLVGFITTVFIKLEKIKIDNFLSKFIKIVVGMVVVVIITNVVIAVYAKSNSFDYMPAKNASEWISDNSQGGDKVFLSNWGLFTIMFFNNHDNKYSMGLEPNGLKNQDRDIYWKYYNIFTYNYYCEVAGDCKEELENRKKQFKKLTKEQKVIMEKDNSKKIIKFIKNDFDARFIISSSNAFTETIKLNPEMIEKIFYVESDKFKGNFMKLTVFKLK